ncbi:MAG: PKD domain-containing protein [Nanoarchaeota archaeon]|nr:PKD domain-containing protein [Nanoarchaeota archaeon]MBU1269722.1 PKD domain-containing protein [Nanoarchaeota archaeon]MBU1604023.1 PKD domain-containing protein [Nanoarchaeota archaeon]
MKKSINLLITIIILSAFSEASLVAYIQFPANDPTTIKFGEGASFQGYASNGTEPYTYAWIFCAACTPDVSISKTPGLVMFGTPGSYNISYTVTDNIGKIVKDNTIIRVKLAEITYPANNTYWGSNETIPFEGKGLYVDNTTTFTYWWDFGDTTVNNNFAAQRSSQKPVGVNYPSAGKYNVSLQVTHPLTSAQETTNITIRMVAPIDKNFTCTIKQNSCLPSEIELLRLFKPTNSQTRSVDDLEKNWYTYPLCCQSPSLTVQRTDDHNSPAIYLTLETDLDSQIGGSHITEQSNPNNQYYELTSNEGTAPVCEVYFLGLNGKCSDYNKLKCLYEFYPGPESISRSHLSNCTIDSQPNSFGTETWGMCCDIAEDCTNNLDDDENIWFDCNDAKVCTVKNNERPCGTSDELLQNPTCNWMQTECTEEGCDFTNYSTPYWDNTSNTWGFLLSTEANHCRAYFLNNNWQFADCPIGTNESSIIIPQSAENAVSSVNVLYYPLNTTAKELYFKCRYYFCSAGKDDSRPLPAFVDNMAIYGNETRHCCPLGTYWDPAENNDFNESGKCMPFAQCYDQFDSTNQYPCQNDFLIDFFGWAENVNGTTNPDHIPKDCIRDDLINAGIKESTLCCPVWRNNENTYDMIDIVYYRVP